MPGQSDKKILIVEDDKEFLWILKQSLVSEGFNVLSVMSGEEGLDVAEKEKLDLIVIDILLPKMDGITMAKKLREKGNKSQIIFLTQFKDADHISEAMAATDKTEYIVKSDVHVDDIVARISKKLGV